MEDLLKLLKKAGYPVYEHKLRNKFGFDKVFFDKAETDGFIERIDRGHRYYPGIKITQAGLDELDRLESIKPPEPEPTTEELRLEELKVKIKDDTATLEEIREFLRLQL